MSAATRTVTDPSPGVAIELRGVVHLYPTFEGDVVALRGVDLEVPPGTTVALLGPSGAGKSTVLSLIAGRLAASAGQVLVGGEDVGRMGPGRLARFRALQVSLVSQGAASNLLPYATVTENLWFAQRGAIAHRRPPPRSPAQVLEAFDSADLADRVVGKLPPGTQQLVAVMAGMAPSPEALLLDEPTSRLDPGARDQVLGAISVATETFGTTVVLVTHDPAVAGAVERTVTVRDGRVGSEGLGGVEFAVVGPDGSLQLSAAVLDLLPPGTLVRLLTHRDGSVELRPRKP